MLVIGTASSGASLLWSGRRHDDEGPGVVRGATVGALFEALFHALHDGEQVAIGFPAPLGLAGGATDDAAVDAALAKAQESSAVVRHMVALLEELGHWRSWTVVSTSLPRWRATTSVLIWEADVSPDAAETELDDAVEGFYSLVHARAERGSESATVPVLNLAAAAARTAQLTVNPDQLREPVLLVRPDPQLSDPQRRGPRNHEVDISSMTS